MNADKLSSAKYRHVLLVDRNLKPITTHAGGIAWYGHYLYVAETHVGLRVFDMQHILKASIEGYAYALPQAGTFRTTSELTFSFVSVDRATPSLLTGEYVAGKAGGRLVQWTLGPDGLLVPGAAQGRLDGADQAGPRRAAARRQAHHLVEQRQRGRHAPHRRAESDRDVAAVVGRRRGPQLRADQRPRVLAHREAGAAGGVCGACPVGTLWIRTCMWSSW